MFLDCFREYDEVINIDQYSGCEILEDSLDETLEGGGGCCSAERHDAKLVETAPCSEGGFWSILFSQGYLPIATSQIDMGEYASVFQLIEQVANVRDRKLILD